MTAALIASAAAIVLSVLARLRPSLPVVMPRYTGWHGAYSDVASWAAWVLGDTTEPGYAHSALAGAMMLLGGYLAQLAFRSKKRWMGFPVTSGTGLFGWAVGSAALGLVLSNAAWGWTIAVSGMWYPTFVPVVSIAPATVFAFDGSVQAIVTGAVLGALMGPPFAAAVARRLPPDFHPFIGNVVAMAASTATIVTALSVLPDFG